MPLRPWEAFVETYQIKYERAADCLTKDHDALLAFYDFPAEHWKHLRTTNPIESKQAQDRAIDDFNASRRSYAGTAS